MLATGGTIASRSTTRGHSATVPGNTLIAASAVPDGIQVDVVDVASRGSFSWQLSDVDDLLLRIDTALDDGVDAVVVTHGTDTLEEVAFLASLAHDDDRPVVFTGAQRPFDDPAPDGPGNLADALAVAASWRAHGRGVLVCFDGHVFAACGVRKVDTLSAHAFDAPDRGPVLRVRGRQVWPMTAAHRSPAIYRPDPHPTAPRVDVVPLYVGVDDTMVRAAVGAGAQGIVLEAFGAGNANPAVVDAVTEFAISGGVTVVCSRTGSGPVLALYTGGGGADLERAGAVFAADMSPWQARLLLMAALRTEPARAGEVVAEWCAAATAADGKP